MNNKLNTFYYSESESEILGIKVARIDNADFIDVDYIKSIILQGEFDLLRIKLDANDRNSLILLENLNIPYYILNISNVYRIKLENHLQPIYNKKILSYKKYSSKESKTLEHLIREIYAQVPGTYYLNPIFEKLPASKEIDAMVKYTLSYNESIDNNKTTYLIYKDNDCIGFFSIRLYEEHSEGNLFGILPQFRGKEYANDIIKFVMQFLYDRGKSYFDVNIQLHNLPSLNTHISLGYKPVKALLNIHINCLLSKTQAKPKIANYFHKDEDSFYKDITKYLKEIYIKNYYLSGFKHVFSDALEYGKFYNIEINTPYFTAKEIMFIVKIYSEKMLCSFAYFKYCSK